MVAVAPVNLLSTRGLSRHFGGLKAVDSVDFDLPTGEIRAIIGPNGAGKTTFVELICGRVAPNAGRIAFAGEDITSLPAHRRVDRGIAYTFQITSVFGGLSASNNVALAVQSSMQWRAKHWRPLDHAELSARTLHALERVGLAGRAKAKAAELPYGHQRLLEVAMGLALRPKLLILDEPTQGLSDPEIEAFCLLIRDVAADATVLLIEHNMDVVMQLAHRITVMERGRILAEGTPAEIRANAAVQQAYLGA
jgi:branched-chain amino acid transport system ATP-binding protein